ncbi:MAG: 16S rRNA (cytidine(1402)-2'-O)-methyltransferase [Coriobacteriales bacterium]|jgi:16S rRNA (cytidine1402-2'-O)-methyltransferase|nr:16S rRNA (cytidine(1402)-2'-O)-methyltransferase [Coriobacteriales bacterium]
MSKRETGSGGEAGILAVIALGSNLGDSAATLAAAARQIAAAPEISLVALSGTYTSRPAHVAEQPLFKNAVMLARTTLSPLELLQLLQSTESAFGRVRDGEGSVPYGPRTLDLDIIDIEGIVCHGPDLTLPHPESLRRAFVVTPLLEISPHHVLADNTAVNTRHIECGEIIDGPVPESRQGAAEEAEAESGIAELAHGSFQDPSTPVAGSACRAGRLSVCATPIGNLGDITLRVLQALQDADVVYCEDTRITRRLTTHYHIQTPLRRADAHRLPALLPALLAELEAGRHLAYVSDAGMPGISDPGALLVASVREAGYSVEVLPGASALTTALAAAGIKARSSYFGGFFPRKTGAGTRLLTELAELEDTTLVFYESVYRTAKTLQLIAELLPTRRVVMARELTKLYEEVLTGTAGDLVELLAQRSAEGRKLKGEIVLLIAPESG